MRGRKPKPIALKVAQGDTRREGVHKLQARIEAEPKTTRGLPDCPEHLTGRAREAWGFWAAELKDMRLDRRPDAMMLEGACVSYENAVACGELIAKHGRLIPKRVQDPVTQQLIVVDLKPHPAVAMARAAWHQVRLFCAEFGLSPSSRTRVAADSPDDPAELNLMKILSQPRENKTGRVQ